MKPTLWQRLAREAQSGRSVALAGLGTGLLAAGVANPLFAVLAVPVYGAWGAYLVSRAFRTEDVRATAISEIEAILARVAKLRYGAEHPPPAEGEDSGQAARVRAQWERLLKDLDIARTGARQNGAPAQPALEFEERLRQFRRICAGEDAVLNRLKESPSAIGSLPPSLMVDVSQLVNWAEAISRQRAGYLLTLTEHAIAPTVQRLEQKRRDLTRAPEGERADLAESVRLLESEVERYGELQKEVRTIENQLDMIESLVRNLILSTPNVPSAREQIERVKQNVETYQAVNRETRERLESMSATLARRSGAAE